MTSEIVDLTRSLPNLTPKEIVAQLDRYIIGQKRAKRAVAIALRNRRRRQQVEGDLKDEILPKNILMVGPTGVGKTEIARRLAKLAHAPFVKVEASKFTEVGYVGRDVESMIRDLAEIAISMVKDEQAAIVHDLARNNAIERVLDLYHPPLKKAANLSEADQAEIDDRHERQRDKLRSEFAEGKLDDMPVEMDINDSQMPTVSMFNATGVEEIGFQIKDMMPNLFGGGQKKRKQMPVNEAFDRLLNEEQQKMIDMDSVTKVAIDRVENSGIVFLDELDKVASSGGRAGGPDVSREGVQRDLLPIVEGSTVNTKYGMIRTDHILFIAAGAFHVAKPSDLIPELQGRFPIQVELDSLTEDDFYRILVEPKNSLIKQYQALMTTEKLVLEFNDSGVRSLARIAYAANEQTENIGARRLHTVMESVMDEISFHADEMAGQTVNIDEAYVVNATSDALRRDDFRKYVL